MFGWKTVSFVISCSFTPDYQAVTDVLNVDVDCVELMVVISVSSSCFNNNDQCYQRAAGNLVFLHTKDASKNDNRG